MKKIIWCVFLLIAVSGCASTQDIRKAEFLSDSFSVQVQKKIMIVSLIDARADKARDIQDLLANKNVRSMFMSNPLQAKGYKVNLLDTDTSKCESLANINTAEDLSCLNDKIFQDGDLFMLVSIDQYTPPEAMHVIGHTKVTGVIYSKSLNAFIWKDSIDGDYGGTGSAYSGVGGFVGMLTLKAMSKNLILRNNVYSAISELFKSVPPFSK